jgi:hypothetical protein
MKQGTEKSTQSFIKAYHFSFSAQAEIHIKKAVIGNHGNYETKAPES